MVGGLNGCFFEISEPWLRPGLTLSQRVTKDHYHPIITMDRRDPYVTIMISDGLSARNILYAYALNSA